MDAILTGQFIDGMLLTNGFQSHSRFEVGARIGGAVVPWACSLAAIVLQLAPRNDLTQFLGTIIIWYDTGMLSALTGSWAPTGNRRWMRPNAWFLDCLDTTVVDIARLAWIQDDFVL
jgi:hypothetical protein